MASTPWVLLSQSERPDSPPPGAAHRWVALLLGVSLLTTGCVTLAPPPGGSGTQGPRALLRSHPTPSSLTSTQAGEAEPLFSTDADEPERLHRRRGARGLISDTWVGSDETASPAVASGGLLPQGQASCGGQSLPPGWPDFSSEDEEELLVPFLTCTSPAEFVALQQRVDMPRLVEALDDWGAVRLGALGSMREDAAHLLQRKRAAFLVSATERYGPFHAEVFALFVLHSAHDDEVDAVLRLLAGDKLLGQTLALMPAVREELRARGLPLSGYAERAEQSGDVLRGLGRAARDALATSQTVEGPRYMELTGRWTRLPPPYQQAAQEVERALALRHFSAGSVALGTFDAMTFGVPLGFSYLVAGMGQGAYSLSQGHYEQATRELAPAVLLGALYAGGKGLRALSEARGATGASSPVLGGLQTMELRLRGLREMARQLEAKLGVDGLRELARDIRARREVGRFVAVGGVDAALALREARGDVARAQALLSRARPGATGTSAARRGAGTVPGEMAPVADDAVRSPPRRAGAAERAGSLASLVDEGTGLTREVVEARLALVELDAPGPRLPRDVAVLEKQRPSPGAPPPGTEGNPRWGEYVAYYEKRLGEFKQGKAAKAPLRWMPYEQMRGWFSRGLAFERLMVELLREDAKLPRVRRRFLGDFDRPRLQRSVGVKKPESGLRYADVLIIEEGELPGRPRRVETLSFKSRDLSQLNPDVLKEQMIADAREALQKYGGTLDIRRDSLQPLLLQGSKVPVQRVRLIYEGGELKPRDVRELMRAVNATKSEVPGVEVLFQ